MRVDGIPEREVVSSELWIYTAKPVTDRRVLRVIVSTYLEGGEPWGEDTILLSDAAARRLHRWLGDWIEGGGEAAPPLVQG